MSLPSSSSVLSYTPSPASVDSSNTMPPPFGDLSPTGSSSPEASSATSSASSTRPTSPPETAPHRPPPLKISVPEPTPEPEPDWEAAVEMSLQDPNLTTLERMWLLSNSGAEHRKLYVATNFASFLQDVQPSEAVEFLIPMVERLICDEDDRVKEAFAPSFMDITWWFYTHCHVVADETVLPEDPQETPLLNVHTFTKMTKDLLLDQNTKVTEDVRQQIADMFGKLRTRAADNDLFGDEERALVERAIIEGVIIGLRKPYEDLQEQTEESQSLQSPVESRLAMTPPQAKNQEALSPPSAPLPPLPPPFALPSPAPDSTPVLSPGNASLSPNSPVQPSSPVQDTSIFHELRRFDDADDDSFARWVPPSPHPSSLPTFPDPLSMDDSYEDSDGWVRAGGDNLGSNERQRSMESGDVSYGTLASMSLIAAVTASGHHSEEILRLFVQEVERACSDPAYWARREACFVIGALAKVVPFEVVTSNLIPLFDAALRDPVWNVRNAALYAVPHLIARLTSQRRRTLTLSVIKAVKDDNSSAVRTGFLETLGEVIHKFKDDEGGPPDELITMFLGTDDGHRWDEHNETDTWLSNVEGSSPFSFGFGFGLLREGDSSSLMGMFGSSPQTLEATSGLFRDPERPIICAFNYPAVALTLGPVKWQGDVREYYIYLTKDKTPKVRRTLAASIGPMAKILGPDLARSDLMPLFWDTIKFDDSEVRKLLVEGMDAFLSEIAEPERAAIAASLDEIWNKSLTGWREREEMAKKLGAIAKALKNHGNAICNLTKHAIHDEVAAVREAAAASIPAIFDVLPQRDVTRLREDISGLVQATSYRKRAIFVACCQALVEGSRGAQEVKSDVMWDGLTKLAEDQIVGVRIGVARLVGIICDRFYSTSGSRPSRISDLVRRMSKDTSTEVRSFVTALLVPGSPSVLTSPVIPSSFATFSRPPPPTPLLQSIVAEMDALEDDLTMELDIDEDDMAGLDASAETLEMPKLTIHSTGAGVGSTESDCSSDLVTPDSNFDSGTGTPQVSDIHGAVLPSSMKLPSPLPDFEDDGDDPFAEFVTKRRGEHPGETVSVASA